MGAALSCLALPALGTVGSWIGGCFSAAVCSLGCKSCHCSNSIATRVGYALIFLLNTILAWIMLSPWAAKQLERITLDYLKLSCSEGECYSVLAVHRVCFAMTLFHTLLALLTIGVTDSRQPRAAVQNGWWGPKVLIWLALVAASFFLPNGFISIWGTYIAPIGATLFILFGLVLLVDFAHSWTEGCLDRFEMTDSNLWKYILIGGTLLLYAGMLTMTGMMYVFFGGSMCQMNVFAVTLNLILCFLNTLLCITPAIQDANPRSGLSQASIVIVYCTYLVLSALANKPSDGSCSPAHFVQGSQTTTIILGSMFTFLAISYSTSRAASQAGQIQLSEADDEDDADDEQQSTVYNYSIFHVVFAVATLYVAMLLSNWNTIKVNDDDQDHDVIAISQSIVSSWIKIVSSWICHALYGWTLVAPVLMPDRFGDAY